jgi:phage minor structural protein
VLCMSTDIELYPRDQTDFSHHGYALDDISNDIVTWQLNAKFTLTFDYPMFSEHAGDLVAENIVRVPVPGGKAAFRIAQVIKSMGHLSITAYHVFWDLNDDFIADTNIVDKDGQGALDQIMRAANYPTGFKVLSTIGNVTNARLVRMSIIKALLGTDDNSFLNRWGGEFDWQDFSFSVNPRLGKDRGVHFEYAHNLTGYEATKDSSGIITRLLPEGYNGLLLPELYVDSPKLGNYRKPKIGTKTYQDIKAIDETQATGDQEGAVPVQEAYELLRAAAAKEFSESHIDEAQWTYKLNVALLENTEEYKDLSITTTVLPGDTVTITHKLDGIDVRARLTGYTWQPSNHSYLTQTYDSASRPDVAYSNLSSRVNEIKSQIELVDKVVIAKATNGMNSTGWGDQSPVDLNIAGKTGDVYYQTTAKGTIMWLFHDGQWNAETGDAFGTEVQKKVDTAITDVAAAKQAANDAVAKASAAVSSSGLATTTANAASDAASAAKQLATEVSNNFATVKAQATTAASDAATALDQAKSALATANGASGNYTSLKKIVDDTTATVSTLATQTSVDAVKQTVTTTKSLAEQTANGLTLKADNSVVDTINNTVKQQAIDIKAAQDKLAVTLTASDLTKGLSGYATQAWTQNQITATADGINSTLSSVKTTVDDQTTSINDLKADSSSFKSQFTTVNNTLGKQTTDIGNLQATSKELTTGFNTLTSDNTTNKNDISQLKQTATEVSSTLETVQTQVQNSAVGTNLAYGTDQEYAMGFGIPNTTWEDGYAFETLPLASGFSGNEILPQDPHTFWYTLIQGTTYTQTIWFETDATVKNLSGAQITWYTSSAHDYQPASFQKLGQNRYKIYSTYTWPGKSYNNLRVFDIASFNSAFDLSTGTYLKFGKLKLEKGSLSTDWCLNPAETATVTAVSKLSQTVDGLTATFATKNDLATTTTQVKATASGLSAITAVTGTKGENVAQVIVDVNNIKTTMTGANGVTTRLQTLEGFQQTATSQLNEKASQSQITQLQGLIDERVTVDGKIAAALSLSADGGGTVLITGKSVHITGETTIDNAVIKSAMIDTITADKIIAGTLNAANLNVINLNASAIVTGTISGANLAINLNTGMVEFQKGRIHSTDNNIDINVDQKYISVTDSNNSVLLKGGSMTFTQPYAFDTDQTPYLTIDNVGSSQTLGRGAEIVGRDVLTVSVSGENNSFLSGVPLFQKDFSGISISKNYDTVVGGANRGVRIIGGGSYSTGLGMSTVPSIMVGYNDGAVTGKGSGGTRINIEADYVQIPSAWSKTTSSSPNAFVASDGALVRSTSASKYKVNIERTRSTDLAERLLTVPNAHWLDKAAMERYASGEQKELPQTNFGLIAEDLEAAGLEDLVVRGPDGELEGIQYDRIAAALLPLLAQMKTEIDELKATA